MDNSIFQSEYNEEGKINLIFNNFTKMIYNRKIIKNQDEFNTALHNNYDNDITYYDNKEVKIAVKLLFRKITTIRKVEDIEDFLENYKTYYKFIIVLQISPKVYKQLIEYDNIEIFYDKDFYINIIDHIFVPKHIMLSLEEQENIKNEYGFKKNEIGKIKYSDPIARYYNLKIGEIICIQRPSISSGISIYYRICIPSPLL
jgi:DNA-directed RNA polymerase subunit H (RpoH/RPB5)